MVLVDHGQEWGTVHLHYILHPLRWVKIKRLQNIAYVTSLDVSHCRLLTSRSYPADPNDGCALDGCPPEGGVLGVESMKR